MFVERYMVAQRLLFCCFAVERLRSIIGPYDQSISIARIPYLFVRCFYGAGQFVLLKWK